MIDVARRAPNPWMLAPRSARFHRQHQGASNASSPGERSVACFEAHGRGSRRPHARSISPPSIRADRQCCTSRSIDEDRFFAPRRSDAARSTTNTTRNPLTTALDDDAVDDECRRAVRRARKKLGQHFLHHRPTRARVVRAVCPQTKDVLVEIGSGCGCLTRDMLHAGSTVVAVEYDPALIVVLRRRFRCHRRVDVRHADALSVDLTELTRCCGFPLRMFGNIPYNISIALLFHVLKHRSVVRDAHFLFQHEVARRLVARTGASAYGALSVLTQCLCRTSSIVERIPPEVFAPPPRVHSSLVRIAPRTRPYLTEAQFAVLRNLVASAFGQRRKIVRNSLRKFFDSAQLAAHRIDGTMRAENLSVQEYCRLAARYCKRIHTPPDARRE